MSRQIYNHRTSDFLKREFYRKNKLYFINIDFNINID